MNKKLWILLIVWCPILLLVVVVGGGYFADSLSDYNRLLEIYEQKSIYGGGSCDEEIVNAEFFRGFPYGSDSSATCIKRVDANSYYELADHYYTWATGNGFSCEIRAQAYIQCEDLARIPTQDYDVYLANSDQYCRDIQSTGSARWSENLGWTRCSKKYLLNPNEIDVERSYSITTQQARENNYSCSLIRDYDELRCFNEEFFQRVDLFFEPVEDDFEIRMYYR